MQPRWLPLLEACDPESITNLWLIDSPAPQGEFWGANCKLNGPISLTLDLSIKSEQILRLELFKKGRDKMRWLVRKGFILLVSRCRY